MDWDVEAGAGAKDQDLARGGVAGAAASPSRWGEPAKHVLLLLRLQRPYFVYCLLCAVLAASAFFSTLVDLLDSHRRGGRRWEDVLEGETWQRACWMVVGLSLCIEVASNAIIRRGSRLICDMWSALDAVVVLLTILAWALTRLRRASPEREEAEEADLWLLALRFALQPCRVLVAAKMTRKVRQMQVNHLDITFDAIDTGERR